MNNNYNDQLATLLEKHYDGFVFWVTRSDGTEPTYINLLSSSSLFDEFEDANIGDRFRVRTSHARNQIHMIIGSAPIPPA